MNFQQTNVVKLLRLSSDNTKFHLRKTEKELNNYSSLLLVKCRLIILSWQPYGWKYNGEEKEGHMSISRNLLLKAHYKNASRI